MIWTTRFLLFGLALIPFSNCSIDEMFLCDTLTCSSECLFIGDGKPYASDQLSCPENKSLTCCPPYCYCCTGGICPATGSSCTGNNAAPSCEYPVVRSENEEPPPQIIIDKETPQTAETSSSWEWPNNFY
ncbi:unnamed protein product [Orchesella dallaii]|uniref:Uncharacterized protein n=1 Tax=Orchesella dallaii TaxID=48710 RepID=A0ABP1RGR9_9HEXA